MIERVGKRQHPYTKNITISQPKEDTSNLAAIGESIIERYFMEYVGNKTFYLIIKKINYRRKKLCHVTQDLAGNYLVD